MTMTTFSRDPSAQDANGQDRMLLLLSAMEASSGSSSTFSLSNNNQVPGNCSTRSFSASTSAVTASDTSSSSNHKEGAIEQETRKQVSSGGVQRMPHAQVPASPTNSKAGFYRRYTAKNNGLRSLLLASAKPPQGYMDLESQLSPTLAYGANISAEESPLHRACRHKCSDQCSVIANILQGDKMAIRRRCQLPKISVEISSIYREQRQHYEPYSLPLNLAIFYFDASMIHSLKLLAKSGPDVLTLADGPDRAGSLSIALRHCPREFELVELLLEANPSCALATDNHQNTPLHVACLRGASLPVIRRVYCANPKALYQPNWNGDTPYHIVQRNPTLTSTAVADFFFVVPARRERRKPR